MTNQLTKAFNGNNVRIVEINGEFWFVAKDVCDVLGINNSRQALTRLDEDEKAGVIINDGSQNRNVSAVNEYGIYNLVFTSTKPEAKEFKRWVTHEVLPSIRKTGSYTQKPLSTLEMIAQMAAEAAAQERRLLEIEQKQVEVANEFTNIKETILINNQDWRNKVNRAINAIAKQRGGGREFQETRKESYELLEQRAKCRLEIRLNNMKKDALANGVISKNKIDGFNKMDVIENDTRLLEIYLSVVKEMSIAHHIDVNIINQ